MPKSTGAKGRLDEPMLGRMWEYRKDGGVRKASWQNAALPHDLLHKQPQVQGKRLRAAHGCYHQPASVSGRTQQPLTRALPGSMTLCAACRSCQTV